MSEITQLLKRAAQGEAAATNQLMPMIYDRLRAVAHYQLDHVPQRRTLETTALVHEAYLALFNNEDLDWNDRAHFFSYAAKTMRRILISNARRGTADKRGGEAERIDIADVSIAIHDDTLDLLALDQALTQMTTDHPRLVEILELRFFAGLSVEDTAAALNIDDRTVIRDWRKARAFLNLAMGIPEKI